MHAWSSRKVAASLNVMMKSVSPASMGFSHTAQWTPPWLAPPTMSRNGRDDDQRRMRARRSSIDTGGSDINSAHELRRRVTDFGGMR